MAKLKLYVQGEIIVLEGACTARACGGRYRREVELESLLELLKREEIGAAKFHLAKQGFRAMVAKLGLDVEPDPSEVNAPLICGECLRYLNENPRQHREEPGD